MKPEVSTRSTPGGQPHPLQALGHRFAVGGGVVADVAEIEPTSQDFSKGLRRPGQDLAAAPHNPVEVESHQADASTRG